MNSKRCGTKLLWGNSKHYAMGLTGDPHATQHADGTVYYDTLRLFVLNLLKPTGHVMHHQFNIQQLYALPTLYLCVLYLSENKQRLVPLTA